MKTTIKNNGKTMKKYEVLEMWDGGDGYYFNSLAEAKAKAKDITEEPKWTAWELEQYKKKGENYVSIFEAEIDADGYEDARQEVETFVIDDTTLFKIYEG